MSDVLNEIKPGQEMSPEQKEKLAKSNETASNEAMRLAAEARARDAGLPQVNVSVADSIKDKLLREDFKKHE